MARSRVLPFPVIIIVTLLVQLATPGIAWADGESPPTEAQPAIEVSTEPVPTVGEILTDAPAGTGLLVVDSTGTPEPLASQQAAEAISTSDPEWCPAGSSPGDSGCTGPYGTVGALLTAIGLGPYSGDGTIFFTTPYAVDDAYIRGTDARLAALHALTINGQIPANTLSVPLEVTGWAYDVSISNLNMNLGGLGSPANALRVETTGTIQLTDVDITGSNGGGAFLDNSSGTGSISVTNSSFNANTWTGLDGRSDGNITLTNVDAGGQEDGAYLDASTGSGNIVVTGGGFSTNTLAGLTARTADGDITLTNVTANTNSSTPASPTGGGTPTLTSPTIVGSAGVARRPAEGGAVRSEMGFSWNASTSDGRRARKTSNSVAALSAGAILTTLATRCLRRHGCSPRPAWPAGEKPPIHLQENRLLVLPGVAHSRSQ
jgi:hypothetical protein